MKSKPLVLSVVYFFSVLTLVNAVTVDINAPQLTDGITSNVNFTIEADPSFNGTVLLSYTNLDSGTTSVNFLSTDFQSDEYTYVWQVTPQTSDDYSIHAEVRNDQAVVQATQNKTGDVNSTGPKILTYAPSGSVSSSTVGIIVSTDVDATCKYDSSNKSYDSMSSTFSTTGAKNHSQTLSDLTVGTYNYYVLCKDSDNRVTYTPLHIQFTVDNLPTAKIKLADPSPVKEGIVEVTVVTSKHLPDAPTLEYSYNTRPNERFQISLTGSGSDWQGYLVVTDDDDNKVGTFYFQGVDAEGNIGTRITNNNLFVVDTEKPPSPSSIKALTQVDGSIRVNWYYDGEEIDYFNLYRTTASGVNYVDFYGRSNGSQFFFDRSTLDKVTYYYKVAAVDLAGNEGPLSGEVFATSLNKVPGTETQTQQQEEPEVEQVLPPDLVPKVDESIKDVERLRIDVEQISSDLDSASAEEKELTEKFSIKTKLKDAESKLGALKTQLENYKKTYATESELDAKLKTVDQELQKIRKTTPRGAKLVEKTESAQSTAKEDVKVAAQEAVEDLGLTPEEIEEYINYNTKRRDDFSVEAEAKIISLEYMDGESEEQTLITKRITYASAEALEDVVVVEIIPKQIASHVSEIDFGNKKPEVLNEDPVVKYGFLNFNYQGEEVSYSVDKRIDLEEIANSKSIVLLSFNSIPKDSNSITGLAIFPMNNLGLSKTSSLFVWLGVVTIIALSVYYLVFVKGHTGKRIRRNLTISKLKSGMENRKLGKQFAHHVESYPSFSLPGGHEASKYEKTPVFTTSPEAVQPKSSHPHLQHLSAGQVSGQIANPSEGTDITDLQNLIQQAHIFIQSQRKHEAKQLYPHINNLYQGLPKELKSYYHKQCIELHQKLSR